jgi:hypothetical protein
MKPKEKMCVCKLCGGVYPLIKTKYSYMPKLHIQIQHDINTRNMKDEKILSKWFDVEDKGLI